jgi:hypothetical protein
VLIRRDTLRQIISQSLPQKSTDLATLFPGRRPWAAELPWQRGFNSWAALEYIIFRASKLRVFEVWNILPDVQIVTCSFSPQNNCSTSAAAGRLTLRFHSGRDITETGPSSRHALEKLKLMPTSPMNCLIRCDRSAQ